MSEEEIKKYTTEELITVFEKLVTKMGDNDAPSSYIMGTGEDTYEKDRKRKELIKNEIKLRME